MKYKIQQKQKVYKSYIFDVEKVKLVTPEGKDLWRERVAHNGAAAIIPEIAPDRVILVRQFRYSAGRYLWEIPAGTLNRGESPWRCAQRELIEETGFKARRLKKLNEFYTSPGFCTEKMYLYLAQGLTKTKPKPDEDENIKIRIFSRHEIRRMIKAGRNLDAKSLIGLMLWLQKKI